MLKKYLPSKAIIHWTYLHMKQRIPAIFLLTLCRVATVCLGVVFAFVTKNVINSATSGNSDGFLESCVFLCLIIVIQIVLSSVALNLQEQLLYNCDKDFKSGLLHTIMHSRYEDESRYHSGDLLYRINSDASNIYTSVISIFTAAVSLIAGLVTTTLALASMAPGFTVIIFLICLALAAATLLAQRNMKTVQKDVSARSGKVTAFIQEIIEKLLIVQALDIPDTVEKKAGRLMDEKIELQRRRKNIYLTMNIGSSILGYAGSFITLIWCANCVLNGTMDYGTLMAMTTLVSQLQNPLLTLPAILSKFITMTASGERLMEIEALYRKDDDYLADAGELSKRLDFIAARELTFSYTGKDGKKKTVLKHASFKIEKGCMTVITGPSGIGKSTILKLLLGIYSPDSGLLLLKMKDGTEVSLDRSVRNLFSFAPQGNLILSGSIRDNIMISNPEASEDQLREAVHVSAMDDYLSDLPQGLDTALGENGSGLSEGQIQRINIARAVISGAPILLLDEVTSSLDAATEKKVLERISALKEKTCIVVTHRPAALSLSSYELRVSEEGAENRCITGHSAL